MASIRLFGRGKAGSAQKAAAPRAGGGTAVDADLIAAALADLSTAAVSATWRCRHSTGVSIGEGAVDFGAHRSRATVIRGRATYEYVRDGASVYRAVVPEEGDAAAAAPGLDEADEDEAGQEELAGALDEDELDGLDGLDGGEDEEPELELEAAEAADGEDEDAERLEAPEAEDGEEEESQGDADEDGQELQASDASSSSGGEDEFGDDADKGRDARAWQTFSEHDACGPHAYAEPAVLAQAVRRAGAVQARKAEEFDGVMLSAFTVTAKPKPADPDKLLARLARQLRDHGANTVVVTAFVDESAPPSPAVSDADADTAAESGQGGAESVGSSDTGSATGAGSRAGAPRIVRLRVELPHWTPADDPTADHTVSVDLFELGDPVEIEVPDRDSTTRRTSRTCADLGLF